MIKKIKKKLNTDFAKVTSLTSISTLVRMLTSFGSAKVIALYAGTKGVALLGQLSDFSSIVLPFSMGAFDKGITKYIAEYTEESDKIKIIRTSIKIVILISTITGVFLFLFSSFFSQLIFKNDLYELVFEIFGVTIIFYALNNTFLAILRGFQKYNKFVLINITTSIVGLILTLTLTYLYKTLGVLIAYVTSQSVVFILTLFFLRKEKWFSLKSLSGDIEMKVLKKLMQYSLITVLNVFLQPITLLYIRNLIIEDLGVGQAGIWEGLNRFSNLYLMFITTTLSVYYMPKLSSILDKKVLKSTIINVSKYVISSTILILVIIFLLKDYLILIVLSEEFTPMSDLFLPRLLGDFFKIASWLLGVVLIAKALVKQIFIKQLIYSIVSIGITQYLLHEYELLGAVYGYLFSNVINFIILLFIVRVYLSRNE